MVNLPLCLCQPRFGLITKLPEKKSPIFRFLDALGALALKSFIDCGGIMTIRLLPLPFNNKKKAMVLENKENESALQIF